MVNIKNREEIAHYLKALSSETPNQWGKMGPQHMVEHLAFAVKISTGRNPVILHNTPEGAEAVKARVIYSDEPLQPGIKSPILGDEPSPLLLPDLATAINALLGEVDYFHSYYAENPEAMNMQPRMGLLNHAEWSTLHSKHFAHHFRQFGLMVNESVQSIS